MRLTTRNVGFIFMGFCVLLMPIAGRAAIAFNGSGDPGNTFQQTENNPCVIGDPSCKQPAGMTYTSNTGPGDYDLFSPVYQAVSPFTTYSGNLIPTAFRVGIDSNFATGQGLQNLQFFRTYTCNSTGTACSVDAGNSYTTPTALPNNNNGNGFSDATLNGFSLAAGTFYKFEASVTNATAGMEEFFLVPTTAPIPEPSTMAISTILLVLGMIARRRFKDA